MGRPHLLLMGAACLGLAGCVASPRTELIVFVDSDLARPDPLSRITLSVRHADRELGPFSEVVDPGRANAQALPVSLGITNRTVGDEEIEIRATAANRDGELVAQRARVRFVPGETRALCLRLDEACRGVECGEATCVAGTCLDAHLEAASLPTVDAASVETFSCPRSSHQEVAP